MNGGAKVNIEIKMYWLEGDADQGSVGKEKEYY